MTRPAELFSRHRTSTSPAPQNVAQIRSNNWLRGHLLRSSCKFNSLIASREGHIHLWHLSTAVPTCLGCLRSTLPRRRARSIRITSTMPLHKVLFWSGFGMSLFCLENKPGCVTCFLWKSRKSGETAVSHMLYLLNLGSILQRYTY